MLQQGFGRSSAQNRGLGAMSGSSAEDPCCCSYCCRSTENGDLARTAKTELLPQERCQLVVKLDLRCLPWAMHMHPCLPWPIPAPSWPEGHGPHEVCGGYDRGSKWYNEKQQGTVLVSEAISLASCHMTCNSPQADSPKS